LPSGGRPLRGRDKVDAARRLVVARSRGDQYVDQAPHPQGNDRAPAVAEARLRAASLNAFRQPSGRARSLRGFVGDPLVTLRVMRIDPLAAQQGEGSLVV